MVRSFFTSIADVYDRMNHRLSLGRDRAWRRATVASIQGAPQTILDLACGTGDLTLELARRFPSAKIVGADLTPAMLDVARRKIDLPQVSWVEADACGAQGLKPLAGEAGHFDLVASAFGFRNFPDRLRALHSVRAALAEGGELLVLEFFRPRHPWLWRLVGGWIRILARCCVRVGTPAYSYLVSSVSASPSEEEFVQLAAVAGLTRTARRFFFPCCTMLRFRAPHVGN